MLAPMSRSGAATRSMGRFCSEESPVSTEVNFCPASRPMDRRMAVPALPMSSTLRRRAQTINALAMHGQRSRVVPVDLHAHALQRRQRRQAIGAVKEAAHLGLPGCNAAQHQAAM